MRISVGLVLAALATCSAAKPIGFGSGISIPLHRRYEFNDANNTVDPEFLLAHEEMIISKILRGFSNYEQHTGSPHPLALNASHITRRADVGVAKLSRVPLYPLLVASVDVGTPPVRHQVILDTASADLALPAPGCVKYCMHDLPYDYAHSSTSKPVVHDNFNGRIGGGGAMIEGKMRTDTVTISGLTATNQTIGVVERYLSSFAPYNHVTMWYPTIGMGWPSISAYQGNSLFHTLVKQHAVSQPIFTLKVASSGSELFLGGVNHIQDFTWIPIATPYALFQITVGGIFAGPPPENPPPLSKYGIFDSGSFFIYIPVEFLSDFYKNIPGSVAISPQAYTIPCHGNLPEITMRLGGTHSFSISPQSLRGPVYNDQCIGTVLSHPIMYWVIGIPFFGGRSIAFDISQGRVGISN